LFTSSKANGSKVFNGITAFFYRGVIRVGMRVVTFKIEQDDLEKMEVVRMAMGMERSEFIRKAIQYFIEHEYKPKENVTKARVEKGVRL